MAFVQKQLFPVSFTGGVDTKTDPKQVLAGNLITLQNGLFNNTKEINKRYGDTQLSNAIFFNPFVSHPTFTPEYITTAQAINVYNQEMLLFDGTNVYSYISEAETWSNKGIAASTITSDKQIVRTNNAQQLNPDVAVLNGSELYAWEDSRGGASGSVRYQINDTVTGAIVLADTQLFDGYGKPKCITYNNQVIVFSSDNVSNIFYQVIDTLNPTVTNAPVKIVTDGYTLTGTGTFSYDCQVVDGYLYVAYLAEDAGVASINLFSLNTSLTKSSVTQIATGSAAFALKTFTSCISVVGDSLGDLWVAWSTGNQVYCVAYDNTFTQIVPASLVYSGVANTITAIQFKLTILDTVQMLYLIDVYNATTYNESIVAVTMTPFFDEPVTGVLLGSLLSVGLASKPYLVVYPNNTNIYVNVAYQTTLNSTYFTILLSPNLFTIVGKVDSGTGGGLRTNNMLPEIPSISSGVFRFVNLTKGEIISEGDTIFTLLGVNSTTLDYTDPDIFNAVTQNENLMIVGGIIQIYDGNSVVESNFHYPPENVSASVSGSGSGLGTGQYQYQVTYEWSDNYGQIEVSTPSPIVTIMVTAGQNVQLTIPTLRLTKKQGTRTQPTICVYRTAVNGTIFNEVTSILAPLSNTVTANTVTFTDTLSDASAASNRLIYTTGGVLDNVAPPAASLISLYQDRVVLSGLEDPNLLWFSQNVQDYSNYNTTPTNFAAELTIGCDPLGGPITAIRNLNQNLVIFKKSYIFTVSGDGPNNTGGGTSYPNPTFLTSDVGCANPNSISVIPANASGQGEIGGLIFQSDKGIYLLDQSLNVTYIGAAVNAFNNLIITSATLVSDQNQVIFTTNDNVNGTSLVYDYYVGQWSTFTNQFAIDAVTFEDLFTYVSSDGYVYQADPTSFTSGDGYAIELSFTTPYFSFAQVEGFQRVFRVIILGEYFGPHTLTVNVDYDYAGTYAQTVTIPIESNPGQYEFRIDFSQQVCSSISLQITDNQTYPGNQGYSISDLTFEIGVLGGANRIPATSTYGTQ